MGLLFEYSRADDYAYQNVPPPDPFPIAQETDEAVEETSHEPRATAQHAANWTGSDIAVAGLVIVAAFIVFGLVMGIGMAFVLIAQNPQLAQSTDPYAAAQELIEPYREAFVLQFFFSAMVYSLALLAGAAYVAFRAKWQWVRLGFRRMTTSRITYAITIGVFGSLIMIGTSLFVNAAATGENQTLAQLDALLQESSQTAIMAAVIVAIVLLPLAEEVFFRGVLYTWLRGRSGVIYAALLSAIAYALLNLNPIGFFPTLAIGAAMALVYERTGSLWGVYLSHSAFNCVTILLYLYALNSLG